LSLLPMWFLDEAHWSAPLPPIFAVFALRPVTVGEEELPRPWPPRYRPPPDCTSPQPPPRSRRPPASTRPG